MSALTGEWSVEKIRAVMVHLDRKTGLHGAELPIELGKAVSHLGRYYCGERKSVTGARCLACRASLESNWPNTCE